MKPIVWLLLFFLTACKSPVYYYDSVWNPPPELASIHIVDRDGLTQAISNPERIKAYGSVDFLSPQPYQKVLRVFSRDDTGAVCSYITTYHSNGQIKQYLEIVNNRAFGSYKEWFSNGNLKVEAHVIEGIADISLSAEKSWQFDGLTFAYDESSHPLATIPYFRGVMEGQATYYHPNGIIWKEIPYQNNLNCGDSNIYLENGALLQTVHHTNGLMDGLSIRYWNPDQIAAKEDYKMGRLMEAHYYDLSGAEIASIHKGFGYRILFGKNAVSEKHEYKEGVEEGEVLVFTPKGGLIKQYLIKKALKNGEEFIYYPNEGDKLRPKLSLMWHDGKVRGHVKTWYENGKMESQKEMTDNKRNGLSTAWYRDGDLMMIEEYDQGNLIKGDYFRKKDRYPVSQILNSTGVATFYDSDGNYLRKVNYFNGKPDE